MSGMDNLGPGPEPEDMPNAALLKRRIQELEAKQRRMSDYHHPACRKMMYDIGSSPCTCEAETATTFKRIEELEAQLQDALALPQAVKEAEHYERLQRKYETLMKRLNKLLESEQQTPMAPTGVTHVWANDLRALLKQEEGDG